MVQSVVCSQYCACVVQMQKCVVMFCVSNLTTNDVSVCVHTKFKNDVVLYKFVANMHITHTVEHSDHNTTHTHT